MLKLLLVGLRQRGTGFLQWCLSLPVVVVVAAIESSPETAGVKLARGAGIPVFADLPEPLDLEIDLVVDCVDPVPAVQALKAFGGKVGHAAILPPEEAWKVVTLIQKRDERLAYLQQSSWQFEAILNSTHDAMIMVDSTGVIKMFNTAAERITGLTAADVIDKPVGAVIPNSRLPIVLQTGEPELNRQQNLGQTTIVTNRMPVRDDQGNLLGAVAVFRDITEVKTLAEELTNLKEIQQMLEAIINCTQDAISVVDEEGKGILINPAYTRLTGLTEKDVIGKPATVDIAEGESMHMQVLATQEPVRGVIMKVGPKRREVMVQVAPILVDGQLRGSVGVIHDLSEIMRLNAELERAKRRIRHLEAKYTFADILGSSPLMMTAVEQAQRAADTPATILLRGESGTGKELFAHAIHNASKRKKGQFIRVNCSAIAESLLESELFGYEEGAFTGARRGGKRGLFEEANGGTLFLDEIAEIHVNLQAKLLRVIQEREIVRVGSTKPVSVDVRIIAATNIDLEKAVREERFRADLYYRINVVPIFIPPLRQRTEDLPLLVQFLLRRFNQEYGRCVESIESEALAVLSHYPWPGNVRELENVLGRAVINMRFNDTILRVHHLPLLGGTQSTKYPSLHIPAQTDNPEPLQNTLQRAERNALLSALEQSGGNKVEAAKSLGISIRSLYYKLEKYRLG